MTSRRRLTSDQTLESLEARLRALPEPPVSNDLETRILAAIPAQASGEMPGWARARRHRRLAICAGASLAIAAMCLLAVRFLPDRDNEDTIPHLVANPETTGVARPVSPRLASESRRILPWFKAQRDGDETEVPSFAWPIQEQTRLIVS